MQFIGRIEELKELERLYSARDAKLAVIYGRRRVGKSTLVQHFIQNKPHLSFEGLEGMQTAEQITQFCEDLKIQINEPLLQYTTFTTWNEIFNYLTSYFESLSSKGIIFIDEFQWLAAGQLKLVSLIKSYWDRYWKKQKVMLILCGSVSSYMVKRVIKSKAMYGRIHWELCLQPFNPHEIYELLNKKRSKDEVLRYALVFGGIPKYLSEIDCNKSFDDNMNKLFFLQNSLFVNEYERIFYSQFKEHKVYEKITRLLQNKNLSLDEISKALKISSGGGAKSYLQNLENAAFITSYIPYNKEINSKLIKYKLTDEYLRFYFKYIEPNLRLIRQNQDRHLFSQIVKAKWDSWLGFAFENYCLKNAYYLAKIMGFSNAVLQWGPYFQKGDEQFQIDLIYIRQDNVITLCEIKYHHKPIGVNVVNSVEKKCGLLKLPRGYTLEKALISRFGADESLLTLDYFHHIISLDDFFN